MSIVVADEGNRRVGEMSIAEIRQCALDIKSWFERVSQISFRSAAKEDFQRLEKTIDLELPEGLVILLSVMDGGSWFMDKQLYSVQKIAEVISLLENSDGWKSYLIPFCGDPSSGLLVVNTRNGQVVEWDEDDGLGDAVASSFTDFLESYRNSLLEGHMEYLDECGVVEKMKTNKK